MNRIITILFSVCFMFLITTSCKQKNEPKAKWNTLAELLDDPSDTYGHTRIILNIAKSISEYPSVDVVGVEEGGVLSKQYSNYMSLERICSENELEKFTNHESANVRAYAFLALSARGYTNLKPILSKHLNDTAVFMYCSKCLGYPKAINLFYLETLAPKLTKPEIQKYRDTIRSNFDPKRWAMITALPPCIYYD